MALFKILRGHAKNLVGTEAQANNTENKLEDLLTRKTKNGWAYFTPDDGRFYIDVSEDEDPIVGSSITTGANRICINAGGFMDNLILDCGTASGWTQIQITYFDLGDSDLTDEEDAIFYDNGDSDLSDEKDVIFYDQGNSYYNV